MVRHHCFTIRDGDVELMYYSNKEDLNLISQMGIIPDVTVHERRRSLKSAALAVRAVIKMQKLAEAWAVNRKVQEQLMMKLESMRRAGKSRGALRVTR